MNKGIIAFAGEATLEKVIWDNVWGQYIFLKLNIHEGVTDPKLAHPFKKFTKMRKGKVGTRFHAVFSLSDETIIYQDEVMLKNWSDGSTGWGLHLWVSPDSDGFHPFMGCRDKQVFALGMVELADDNTAIDQVKRDRLEQTPKKRRDLTLSNYAAQLCKQLEFYAWLEAKHGLTIHRDHINVAATWMRGYLGIDSRAELDTDRHVADQFHADIRRPFARWHSLKTS